MLSGPFVRICYHGRSRIWDVPKRLRVARGEDPSEFLFHATKDLSVSNLDLKQLQYDKFSDAASSYGRSISAFLLVEGRNARYVLILVGLAMLTRAFVVAIMAARTGSIENALTAGSYACGLGGTLIAVLTLLSTLF